MSKPRLISTLGAAQAALLVLAACSSPPAPSVVPDAAPELTDAAPPPHATPVELGRRVRLGATDPVLRPLLPWPREAEDAVAAARDDRGETAWRAPAGPSWLELDLVPWLGTPVPLETLILAFEAADPVPGASVTLSDACGLAGEVRAWPLPEVALDLSGATAGCLRIDFDAAAPFSLASFSLTSRDGRVPATEPAAGAAPWGQDRGEHRRLSGVVEGFYGVPWSWRERRAMVRHLGGLGLGTYIYAPKNDPLHRAEWRTPYPEEEQEAFASLASLGREAGVSICFGISPFVDWGPDPEADYSLLLDKLRSFADLGVQGVALLADDIEFEASVTVDGALGAAHAAIANHLLEDLRADHPDLALWFVPTVYSDDRLDQWEGGGPYLEALRELHPDVPVMWTGTDTFSPTLAAADLDRVRGLIGRRPVIWDNYWANDGGDMFTGRILLAPLDGRAPDLLEGAAGVVTNPMIQGALSRLAVTTLAAWLDDPASYQPKDAARTAAQVEGPEPLLREVMAWFHGATNKSPRFDALEAGVAAVLGSLEDGQVPEDGDVAALLEVLAGMSTAGSRVHASPLDADAADELLHPLRRVSLEGEAGLWILGSLARKLSGSSPDGAWDDAEAAFQASLLCRFEFSTGTVEELRNAVWATAIADRGVRALDDGDPLPAACAAKESWTWRPFEGCDAPGLSGLEGAAAADGVVTWIPPAPGRYRVAAWCVHDRSWGVRVRDLVCSP